MQHLEFRGCASHRRLAVHRVGLVVCRTLVRCRVAHLIRAASREGLTIVGRVANVEADRESIFTNGGPCGMFWAGVDTDQTTITMAEVFISYKSEDRSGQQDRRTDSVCGYTYVVGSHPANRERTTTRSTRNLRLAKAAIVIWSERSWHRRGSRRRLCSPATGKTYFQSCRRGRDRCSVLFAPNG